MAYFISLSNLALCPVGMHDFMLISAPVLLEKWSKLKRTQKGHFVPGDIGRSFVSRDEYVTSLGPFSNQSDTLCTC